METSRVKPGFNGMAGGLDGSSRRAGGCYTGGVGAPTTAGKGSPVDACGVALRVFVLAGTLVAAVVMGVDRQTRTVEITLAESLPPLEVPVTAKWSYSSAFV
jgi:hypothetical protein